MTKEEKIKILQNEIITRQNEIVTFREMIENVDDVEITEDNIAYNPKGKTNE